MIALVPAITVDPSVMKARTVPAPKTDDARWAAVVRRDRAFDGQFFYSVRTTGVYCRPSCASRLARRENVGFYTKFGFDVTETASIHGIVNYFMRRGARAA